MLTLETVYSNFEKWRALGNKRGKISDELWQQVFELLKKYPMSRVGNYLGISNAQIQARSNLSTENSFAEIPIENHITFSAKLELKKANGCSLIIDRIEQPLLLQVLQQFISG